jgi:hypothetical protein
MLKYVAAGAGALLLAAAPALAADQDFTLKNRTGYTIASVYVSAAKTTDWEDDVMGRDVLEDGESVDISFPSRASACIYDLKVVYDDKEEAVWGGLNLCKVSEVEIHYNPKTRETSALTD